MIPASVSTVTTTLLWLKRWFRSGGWYARTRVIFILGMAACALGAEARPAPTTTGKDFSRERRFMENLLRVHRDGPIVYRVFGRGQAAPMDGAHRSIFNRIGNPVNHMTRSPLIFVFTIFLAG